MTTPIQLEIQTEKVARNNERRDPNKPFERQKRKKFFPKELEEETLNALKGIVEKQRTQTQFVEKTIETSSVALKQVDHSTQMGQLYGKLVGQLTHMHKQGIKETTITLGDDFKGSIFKGAKVTITEYSTAPKIFNIQFTASLDAVNTFQAHAANLTNAMNNGQFGFKLHRVEGILEDRKKHLVEAIAKEKESEHE